MIHDPAGPVGHLRRDLAAFGDPGTLVEVSEVEVEGRLLATWNQDGRALSAEFVVAEAAVGYPVSAAWTGAHSVPYRSFLSGPQMANLRMLARNALNVIDGADHFIAPTATYEAPDGAVTRGESDEILERLAIPGEGRTNVVFIAAEAGVGKTTLLRELVRRKADQYLSGQTEALWLYVDAQGRRLAQLDEAVAAELDDLRARFPYHAISSLVRCGAVILAIDGFDELVGSVGSYEEAFGSLATFITDLDGFGCIVAAARSAYYEQEFLTRANSIRGLSAQAWVLRPVQLEDWTPAKRDLFMTSSAESAGLRGHQIEQFLSQARQVLDADEVGELGYKPLFVSRTIELMRDKLLLNGPSLLDRLIAAYIHRETTQKLLSPSTGEPMIGDESFRLLLSELAEEMWRQETRELSVTSIREVAEVVGEIVGLSGDALAEVVQRLPYAALLAKGSAPGSVSFEHDVFFSYFLAGPLTNAWQQLDHRTMTVLLRRGRLAEEAARLAGRLARTQQSSQSLLSVLSAACDTRRLDVAQVRRNAGGLAAALLQGREEDGLLVRGFDFTDSLLHATTIARATIEDCTFAGTDLTSTRFIECAGQDLVFDRVLVDVDSTRLELHGLPVEAFYGLAVRNRDGDHLAFSPRRILEALRNCGLPSAQENLPVRPVNPDVVETVERLCALYTKTSALTEVDDEMRSVVASPNWSMIRGALLESGIATYEKKQASGQKVFLHRHFRPQDIMRGLAPAADVPAQVSAFWSELEEFGDPL